MAFLKLVEVDKSYQNRTSKVLHNINLEIDQGEFVIIVGRSGSGKSTLLSLIGGLETVSGGDILINDKQINLMTSNQLAEFRRNRISYIFQHYHLIDNYTAVENILLPTIINGNIQQQDWDVASELLAEVGLGEKSNSYPYELSGGQKQRVGIARALMSKSNLILADEPTGDLDSTTSTKIIDLLFDIYLSNKSTDGDSSSQTILLVTHDIDLIREGMRVILLHNGEILADSKKNLEVSKLRDILMTL